MPPDTDSVAQSPCHVTTATTPVATNEQAAGMAHGLQNSQQPLIRVCMYCSVVIDSQPQAYCLLQEPANTTHGACERCTRRFLREFRAGVKSPLLDLIHLRRVHIWGVPYDPYQQQTETAQ